MAIDFWIKTGDTAPSIAAVLKDAAGTIIVLSGSTVKFIMRDKATGVKVVDAAATITNASGGAVKYNWQTGDTGVPDTYNAEFEVHFPDGTYETFPNNKHIQVKVFTDLGGAVTFT